MKKVLVVLLMLAIAGIAFAQDGFSASGEVNLTFGARLDFGSDGTPARDFGSSWLFDFNDAKIGVKGVFGAVSAGVTLQAAGGTGDLNAAFLAVDLAPVELKVGYGWLPWQFWSSLDFEADGNWKFGSSVVKDKYIQAKLGLDSITAYLGLMAEGVGEEGMKDNATFPGFYLGGDFAQDAFSVGVAFAGVIRGDGWDTGTSTRGGFAWTAALHGRVNIEPLSIGLNVALYGDPQLSVSYSINKEKYAYMTYYGEKDFFLEGLLDIGVGLDACFIDVNAGLLMNLAPANAIDKGGEAKLRIAADAAFTLGGGFKLVPGLTFTLPLGVAGGGSVTEKGTMDVGITFLYAF